MLVRHCSQDHSTDVTTYLVHTGQFALSLEVVSHATTNAGTATY